MKNPFSFLSTLLLVILNGTVSISPLQAQSAKEVIDNYFTALGGIQNLNHIETKIEEGFFIKYAPTDPLAFNFIPNDTLKIIFKFKRPNKIYHSSESKESLFAGILCHNGEYFWTQTRKSGNLSIQSREDGDAFIQFNFMGYFDVLQEKDTEIEYLGVEELQGKKYNILKIKRKGWRLYHKYFFDLKTHFLYCAIVMGANSKRYTIYKDYRKVENIYFPFIEEAYDDQWNLTSRAIYVNRQLNIPIDDQEFQPLKTN